MLEIEFPGGAESAVLPNQLPKSRDQRGDTKLGNRGCRLVDDVQHFRQAPG